MNDNRIKQMERVDDNIARYTNSVKKLTEKAKARLKILEDKGIERNNRIKNEQLKTILSQRKQYKNLKEKTLRRKDELEALELAELERMAANSVNELARPNELTSEQLKTQKEFNKLVKQQERISKILEGRGTRKRRPRLSRRKFAANLSLDTDLGEGNNSGRKSCCERVGNTCLRLCGMKGGQRKTKRKRRRKNKRKTKRVKRNKRNKRKRKTRKKKRN